MRLAAGGLPASLNASTMKAGYASLDLENEKRSLRGLRTGDKVMAAAAEENSDIDPLTRLAIRHGTDKWGPHFYAPVYHSLFSHLRDKPVRLLEIGVGGYGFTSIGGASLAMWADYFPNGTIVGIDISEKKLALGPRVTIRRGSQDDPVFLEALSNEFGPFDIIIDDGSHVPEHVLKSFSVLFPRMADVGQYVIEDVQTSFWPNFGGSPDNGGGTVQLAKTMLEHLNYAEFKIVRPNLQVKPLSKMVRSLHAYHNIVVIEKGDNSEPSNFDYQLDNQHAVRAVRTIEKELERFPTPQGSANLITIYTIGRNASKALALAEQALAKWPDNPALLFSAFGAADAVRDTTRKLDYARRLAHLENNSPQIQQILQQCEAEAAGGGAR
jgi:hypothetical protein